MSNHPYLKVILTGSILFALTSIAAAQGSSSCSQVYPGDNSVADSSATVALNIENPGADSVNTVGTFNIPADIKPVNIGFGQSWNSSQRILTVNIGNFAANAQKQVVIDFEGKPAACVVYGNLSGTWSPKPAAGPSSWSQELNFSVILPPSPPVAPPPAQSSPTPAPVPPSQINPTPPSSQPSPTPAPSDQPPAAPAPVINVINVINTVTTAVADTVKDVQASPVVQQVAAPTSVAVGTVGAISTVVVFPWWTFIQLANLAALGSLKKKDRKAWGIVFDKATRRPLSGATVKLLDAAAKKQKNVEITDSDGRFGFLVPAGLYYLGVSKSGFNDYESKLIKVTGEQTEALNIEVPLESKTTRFVFLRSLFAGIKSVFQAGSPWLLVIGTLISLAVLVLFPTTFHLIVFLFYVLIDAIKLIIDRITGRSFGLVIDPATRQPLPLAVVRVFESRFNYLLFTYVTDRNGRFKFLVTPGDYYVTCSKPGYKAYNSELIPIRKADVIKLDISLAKESAAQ